MAEFIRGGMLNRLASEVRRWRWTWIGVAAAIAGPILARDSPQSALLLFVAGLGLAVSAHGTFDADDE